MSRSFSGLNGSGHLDGTAEEQQLFSQGGFTGIRVRNNTEGTAFLDFLFQTHLISNIRLRAPAFHLKSQRKSVILFRLQAQNFACPTPVGYHPSLTDTQASLLAARSVARQALAVSSCEGLDKVVEHRFGQFIDACCPLPAATSGELHA